MTKEEREAKRQEIQKQTEEFLRSGGKIEVVKMGQCSDPVWNYTPIEEE